MTDNLFAKWLIKRLVAERQSLVAQLSKLPLGEPVSVLPLKVNRERLTKRLLRFMPDVDPELAAVILSCSIGEAVALLKKLRPSV